MKTVGGVVLVSILVAGCDIGEGPAEHPAWSDTAAVLPAAREFADSFPAQDCTFDSIPANSICDPYLHPYTNCTQRDLGGGFALQHIKQMHCDPLATLCAGGDGDIEVVRVCVPNAGAGIETVCGPTGARGCAFLAEYPAGVPTICSISARCH